MWDLNRDSCSHSSVTMNLSLNSTLQSTLINDTDLGPKADKQVSLSL